MSAQQPTPGPWKGLSGMIFAANPYGHGEMLVAETRGWGHLTGVGACHFDDDTAVAIQEANTKLIASAPDLYAALEPFADQDECGIGVLVGEREEHTAQCDECQRILAARAALLKARGEA